MRIKNLLREIRFSKRMLSLNKPVKLIGVLVFIYFLGQSVVIPYMALYLKEILGNYSSVGAVIAALHLFAIVWALSLGEFIDKIKKRWYLALILILYLPFAHILLSLKTLIHFIYFRIYHSFTSSSFWLTSESYLRAHSKKGREEESIGLFDFSFGLAMVIGAVIGAFLITKIGWAIMYSIPIFAFFALIISFFLPDRKKSNHIKISFKNLKKELSDFFSNKQLVKITGLLFMFGFCVATIHFMLPLFLDEIGATLFQIGIISAFFRLPILFEWSFSTFKNKKKVIMGGLLSAALLFFLMFLFDNLFLVFLISVLIGVSFSAIHPNLSGKLTTLMPKRQVGELTSVKFALMSLAAGLSPLIAGFIADAFGLRYVFLMGFFIFLVLIALFKWSDIYEVGKKA